MDLWQKLGDREPNFHHFPVPKNMTIFTSLHTRFHFHREQSDSSSPSHTICRELHKLNTPKPANKKYVPSVTGKQMKMMKLEPWLEQLLKEKLVSSIVEITKLSINKLSY